MPALVTSSHVVAPTANGTDGNSAKCRARLQEECEQVAKNARAIVKQCYQRALQRLLNTIASIALG